MLDVHLPQHPTQTWRDFFIHITTIVIGLLVALGLEQPMESYHHRHELRGTHVALARERNDNVRSYDLQGCTGTSQSCATIFALIDHSGEAAKVG